MVTAQSPYKLPVAKVVDVIFSKPLYSDETNPNHFEQHNNCSTVLSANEKSALCPRPIL